MINDPDACPNCGDVECGPTCSCKCCADETEDTVHAYDRPCECCGEVTEEPHPYACPCEECCDVTVASPGPIFFEEVFAEIFDEAYNLLVERQRKYGPENIRQLGLFGVFDRLSSDKIERVRRAFNGQIVNGRVLLQDTTDFGDESFDDALLDIANYALIMLALKRGLWGRPLLDA